MRKNFKRVVSLIVAFVMLVGFIPNINADSDISKNLLGNVVEASGEEGSHSIEIESETPAEPEKPEERTLTFNLNGGVLYNKHEGKYEIKAEEGKTIKLPFAPVRKGHKFLNWGESTLKENSEFLVDGDRTFEANWQVEKYPVRAIFRLDGVQSDKNFTREMMKRVNMRLVNKETGVEHKLYDSSSFVLDTPESSSKYVPYGTYIVKFDIPEGYKVNTEERGGATKQADLPYIAPGDEFVVELNGKIGTKTSGFFVNLTEAKERTLTFNLNGGVLYNKHEGKYEIKAKEGETIKLPFAPVRKGHKFLNWGESTLKENSEFLVDGDRTFEANWQVEKYPVRVIFRLDGVQSDKNFTREMMKKVNMRLVDKKTGVEHKLYDSSSFVLDTPESSSKYVPYGTYVVKFDVPEGYRVNTEERGGATKQADLPYIAPGDEFVVELNGKIGTKISGFFVNLTEAKERTLTFIVDADKPEENIIIKAIEGEVISIPQAPKKEGYTFLYWEGSKYLPEEQYTVVGEDKEFVAKYAKNVIPESEFENEFVDNSEEEKENYHLVKYVVSDDMKDGVNLVGETSYYVRKDSKTLFSKLEKPEINVSEGYEVSERKWNFDKWEEEVNDSIEILVEANLKEYTVTIDTTDVEIKEEYISQKVKHGQVYDLKYAFTMGLKKDGFTLSGYEVVKGSIKKSKDGENLQTLKAFPDKYIIESDVVIKPIFEDTIGEIQLVIIGENPIAQLRNYKVYVVNEHGEKFALTSVNSSVNQRTWKTGKVLTNGTYTVEMEGLVIKGIDSVERYGNPEVQKHSTFEFNNDTITINVKFVDGEPYSSFARYKVNIKDFFKAAVEVKGLDNKRTSEVKLEIFDENGNILNGEFNKYSQYISEKVKEGRYTIKVSDLPEDTKVILNETVSNSKATQGTNENEFELVLNKDNLSGSMGDRIWAALKLVEVEKEEPEQPVEPVTPEEPEEPETPKETETEPETPKETEAETPKETETEVDEKENTQYVFITFKLNGAGEDLVWRVKVGDEIVIPEAPIREGYKFLYWKGSTYYPGDKYTVGNKDKEFNAIWAKDEPKEVAEITKPDNKTTDDKKTVTTVTTVETTKVENKNPKTSDMFSLGLMSIVALSSAGAYVFVSKKKKA